MNARNAGSKSDLEVLHFMWHMQGLCVYYAASAVRVGFSRSMTGNARDLWQSTEWFTQGSVTIFIVIDRLRVTVRTFQQAKSESDSTLARVVASQSPMAIPDGTLFLA